MYSNQAVANRQQAAAHPPACPPQRPARRGPQELLLIALQKLGLDQGELRAHTIAPWASVTFTGSRHSVTLAFTGAEAVAAGETLIDVLPDHEFTIPRHLAADAAVIAVEHVLLPQPQLVVTMEVLLLEDCLAGCEF